MKQCFALYDSLCSNKEDTARDTFNDTFVSENILISTEFSFEY